MRIKALDMVRSVGIRCFLGCALALTLPAPAGTADQPVSDPPTPNTGGAESSPAPSAESKSQPPAAPDSPAELPDSKPTEENEAGVAAEQHETESPEESSVPPDVAIQQTPGALDPTTESDTSQTPADASSDETATAKDTASRFDFVGAHAADAVFDPIVLDVEAARFKDAQPGVTTRQQLEGSWGPPVQAVNDNRTVRYVYQIEGFKQVTVSLREGKVYSIVIDLAEGYPADDLSAELGLADQRWVTIRDEFGTALGQAQPERGVLLSYVPQSDSREVDQLIVEEIDAQSFIQRAAVTLEVRCRAALADLDYAIALAPKDARAHWLRARVLAHIGRFGDALAAAETAVQLAEDLPEYRLTRAQILGELGHHVRAVSETKAAIEQSWKRPQIMAQGLVQLGNQIAAGPGRDYKSAIEHHLEAIRVAEPLTDERRPDVRNVALRALIDAHLGAAQDIAWGAWKRKAEVASRWIERAEEIAQTDGDEQLLLAVARGALSAGVGLEHEFIPDPWIERMKELGRRRIAVSPDPLARRRQQWELGMGLYDALQLAHIREEPEKALEHGKLAVELLERSASIGRELPGYAYMMGRLYFRIGSIHAVSEQDHLAAVEWFDRAAPLVEKPIPISSLADIGRQGETCVSMAVSYWEVGQMEEALRLTRLGVGFMQRAVEQGILEPDVLSVPYHNLARIHRRLGEEDRAAEYERMSARQESTQRR